MNKTLSELKKNWNIFTLFSLYSIKSMLQGRLGVVLFTLGKAVRFIVLFLFIYFLVAKTSTLKGYTVDEAILFYLTFNIIDSLSQLLFREVYRFRQLVVAGELDTILVKPYHPFMRVLVGGIDVLDLIMAGVYIVITAFFIQNTPNITLSSIILYGVLILNGIVIATGFHILVLAFGIISSNIDHGMMIFRDLTSTARFPLEIYREPIRWILTFLLPVGIMMSYPAKGLLGLLSPLNVMIALCIAVFMLLVSVWAWNLALQRYQSWGG